MTQIYRYKSFQDPLALVNSIHTFPELFFSDSRESSPFPGTHSVPRLSNKTDGQLFFQPCGPLYC